MRVGAVLAQFSFQGVTVHSFWALWFSKMSSEARSLRNQRHPYQVRLGLYNDKGM
jgi:hypothetical protein